jgi:hypothetical protein
LRRRARGFEHVLPTTYDRDARLAATLRTPRGIVTLSIVGYKGRAICPRSRIRVGAAASEKLL